MKRTVDLRKLAVLFVFAAVAVGVLGPGVAYAAYGQGQVTERDLAPYAAVARDMGSQQQAINPFGSVERIRIRSDAIIVTYEAPERKSKHRNMVIDYSELVPGSTPAAAGKAGVAGGLQTGTMVRYGILAMLGYAFAKRLRRAMRRVTRGAR